MSNNRLDLGSLEGSSSSTGFVTRKEFDTARRLIRAGDGNALSTLLEGVDEVSPALLYWAAWDHLQLDMVRRLLRAGADPDAACNADVGQPDHFSRMSLRELAEFSSEDGDDALTELLGESAASDAMPSFTAWTSTTQGRLTIHRRGGTLAMTGPKEPGGPFVGLDGLDDEGLASSLVDLVARHGEGFVTAWNIVGEGRLARPDGSAVLLVTFSPDEDEGYPGDDCALTVTLTMTEDSATVIASKTDHDTTIATMAGMEWPPRESFEAVRVHHGE